MNPGCIPLPVDGTLTRAGGTWLSSCPSARSVPTIGTTRPDAGTVLRIDVDQNAGRPSARARGAWSWPPYASWETVEATLFRTDDWAPASSVRRPWVRVGRWTLLYRRAA